MGIWRGAYPTVEEFGDVLLNKPIKATVRTHILDISTTPYVFREQPKAMGILCDHLCQNELLGLSQDNIRIVGSGKIGFSLSPDNFPRPFSEVSDIDVLVVDEKLFDKVWMSMLEWHYPRKGIDLGGADGKWAKTRRKELYWGWFSPDKIRFSGLSFPSVLKPLRDISTAWFNCFQSLSLYPEFSGRHISGRLYRTWDHATLYQEHGLIQIREILR